MRSRGDVFRVFTLWLLAGCWAFCILSLAYFSPLDPPSHAAYGPTEVGNPCGPVGAWVAYALRVSIGYAAWVPLGAAGAAMITAFLRRPVGDWWLRGIGVTLVTAASAAIVRHVVPGSWDGLPEGNGGVIGIASEAVLLQHFGVAGTRLVLSSAVVIGLTLAADDLITWAWGRGRPLTKLVTPSSAWVPVSVLTGVVRRNRDVATGLADTVSGTLRGLFRRSSVPAKGPRLAIRPETSAAGVSSEESDASGQAEPRRLRKVADRSKLPVLGEVQPSAQTPDDRVITDVACRVDPSGDDTPAVWQADGEQGDDAAESADVSADLIDPVDVVAVQAATPTPGYVVKLPSLQKPRQLAPPPPQELGEYELPQWDCLADAEHGFAEAQEAFVREKAAELEQALQEFGIAAKVVEIDTGPVITMYEISLAPGIKVSAITSLSNDIARALKATTIRIVAPVPGKNTVGIEAPNAQKEKVRLKELMQIAPEKTQKMAIPLYLGKDASGDPLITDLASMPHCLIAGTTGSGKSVCINTVIMSIMYTRRPDRVKLILVDPKVVEMAPFRDIPHLMCPVITDSGKATSVLDWACEKMDERYEMLAEAGVRNLDGYNKLTQDELIERFGPGTPEEEAKIPKSLPYIVIIIDELADLMMTSGKEVESYIVRLSQKARAVGIHLILATQRPQATVVTGLIKSNMPSKIAFRVASKMDSRIVLDQNGAELLLGQGDMLFLPPGASRPIRSQGTFIDDKEIRESVKLVKGLAEAQYEPELVQIKSVAAGDGSGERDELFDDAVRVVLETRRGSVSLLQRRLTIGYARASRLIEQMAEAGLVGAYKGSQAREATITLAEWDAMKTAETADAEAGMTV